MVCSGFGFELRSSGIGGFFLEISFITHSTEEKTRFGPKAAARPVGGIGYLPLPSRGPSGLPPIEAPSEEAVLMMKLPKRRARDPPLKGGRLAPVSSRQPAPVMP